MCIQDGGPRGVRRLHPTVKPRQALPHTRGQVTVEALTARAATQLLVQRGAAEGRRQDLLLAFVMHALGLAPPLTLAMQNTVWQRYGALQRALRQAARLRWSPSCKEVFSLLVLDGLPTVARLHTRAVCPCGLEGSRQPGRLHYFWHCEVAADLRQVLGECCCGITLTYHQLLFMLPPSGVHPAVWRVVCLAACQAVWSHRLLTRRGQLPSPVVCQLRRQAVVPHCWALLEDCAAVGRWPWRRRPQLGPLHPFLCFDGPGDRLVVNRPADL